MAIIAHLAFDLPRAINPTVTTFGSTVALPQISPFYKGVGVFLVVNNAASTQNLQVINRDGSSLTSTTAVNHLAAVLTPGDAVRINCTGTKWVLESVGSGVSSDRDTPIEDTEDQLGNAPTIDCPINYRLQDCEGVLDDIITSQDLSTYNNRIIKIQEFPDDCFIVSEDANTEPTLSSVFVLQDFLVCDECGPICSLDQDFKGAAIEFNGPQGQYFAPLGIALEFIRRPEFPSGAVSFQQPGSTTWHHFELISDDMTLDVELRIFPNIGGGDFDDYYWVTENDDDTGESLMGSITYYYIETSSPTPPTSWSTDDRYTSNIHFIMQYKTAVPHANRWSWSLFVSDPFINGGGALTLMTNQTLYVDSSTNPFQQNPHDFAEGSFTAINGLEIGQFHNYLRPTLNSSNQTNYLDSMVISENGMFSICLDDGVQPDILEYSSGDPRRSENPVGLYKDYICTTGIGFGFWMDGLDWDNDREPCSTNPDTGPANFDLDEMRYIDGSQGWSHSAHPKYPGYGTGGDGIGNFWLDHWRLRHRLTAFDVGHSNIGLRAFPYGPGQDSGGWRWIFSAQPGRNCTLLGTGLIQWHKFGGLTPEGIYTLTYASGFLTGDAGITEHQFQSPPPSTVQVFKVEP